MKYLLYISLCFGIFQSAIGQSIIYVDSSSSGVQNGQSWANAYNDLQDALEIAQPSEQIWVAKGTYRPSKDISDDSTAYYKDWVFKLRPGVKLYGGFAGNETKLNQRNWKTDSTVLSGITHWIFGLSRHTYSVVIGDSIDSTGVLDGFYITDAKNNFGDDYRGGGLALSYSNMILSNLVIYNNVGHIGAGIGLYYSSPTLINLWIDNNVSNVTYHQGGGGIYCYRSNPLIINTLITNNHSANFGGGICNNPGSPKLINVTLADNSASHNGNAMMNSHFPNDSSKPVILNSIIMGSSNNSKSRVYFENCIVQYSGGSSGWKGITGIDGGNNIDVSPYFKDVSSSNYKLDYCSPAINAGSNSLLPVDIHDIDFDGDSLETLPIDLFLNMRVQGGTVDLGAIEGTYFEDIDTLTMKLCLGQSVLVHDSLIDSLGIYLLQVPMLGMCDSLVYYKFESQLTKGVLLDTTNYSLKAMTDSAHYQWYDCGNEILLPADTNQVFAPWYPGLFKAITSLNGCVDTSECVVIHKVGIGEIDAELLKVYPNPSSGIFQIEYSGEQELKLLVTDLNGRVVYQESLLSGTGRLDLTKMPKGLYVLRIQSDLGVKSYKLHKE